MPTISFLFKDFQQLLGKQLQIEKFEELLLLYAKGEVEKYDKAADEVTVKLDDTNLPYMWCPEGLARYLRGILSIQKGTEKLKVNGSNYRVIADNSVKKVRPFITAFVAKGKKLDDYLLKQLVQMQEKFCEGYGRRRQKVSIGLYSYKRIAFPVHYKAVAPESVSFAPLEFDKELSLREILAQHPKGQQYGWIIKDSAKYPLLIDDKEKVLSLAPIINSNFTGRLEIGDNEFLFEATGTDEESINLGAS
ncbi:MAG: phenylalanine--tRNA ligase subunit beta, partial [Nanoarchaeota archaeon]